MPLCVATFDEKYCPPFGQGGTSGGFLDTEPTHPGAAVKASQAFTPSDGGDFQRIGAVSMRLQDSRLILLLIIINLIGNSVHVGAQVSVAGRWQCTGTGLQAETINFRLQLTQSGTSVSGFWIIGDDEVPIREGKLQDNRIELITFADDKQFTSVATVEGDELKGTWKDDTGRSGSWQAERVATDGK
jgi:hypothetical protein